MDKAYTGAYVASEYDGTDEVAREKRADDAPADLEPNWRIDHLLSLWPVAAVAVTVVVVANPIAVPACFRSGSGSTRP